MIRVLLVVAVLAVVFYIVSIVDCAAQPPTRHRGVSKGIWILIVVLLPVLGGILWFLIGRTRKTVLAARRAPDDDPEFLGTIGSTADQDERIRRLEEELAQLDAEDDDPRWSPPPAPGDPRRTPPPATGETPDADGDSPRHGAVG